MYPLYSFGGAGDRVMHLALANGFPPPTYAPLLAPFAARGRVVCLPPRPLWPDPPPPDTLASWRTLADDLLAGLRAHDLRDVIAVGHSFGGVTSLLAVLAEPARFRALILLDPTLLPPDLLARVAAAQAAGGASGLPLVEGALKRRARFASVDEAYAYWRARPLMADWPDATVRLYAESLTRPADDGDGVTLTWSPTWEARGYETLFTETWDEVPKLRGLLPVLAVRGTTSNAFVEESARLFRERVPNAAYREIEGHGHLFPMSAPDATRGVMQAWLDEQGL